MTPELRDAVATLYLVFKKYRLVSPLHENEFGPYRAPVTSGLHGMMLDELHEPLTGSLTTWGTLEDFKHVLPRVAELIAERKIHMFGEYDPSIALGCPLRHGEWHKWPEVERASVERFLLALWEDALSLPVTPLNRMSFSEPLHIMAAAEMNLQPALLLWQERLQTSASHFLWDQVSGITLCKLKKFRNGGGAGFLSSFETSRQTTLTFLSWLASAELRSAVEKAAVESVSEEITTQLSYTLLKLEEIQSIVEGLQ